MLKKTIKLGITVAALSCLGLGSVALYSTFNNNTIAKADDGTDVVTPAINVDFEDQINWTSDASGPILRVHNLAFDLNSGYSSATDVTETNITPIDSNNFDVTMDLTSISPNPRSYQWVTPWYITGFTFEIHEVAGTGATSWLADSGTNQIFAYSLTSGQSYQYSLLAANSADDTKGNRYGTMSVATPVAYAASVKTYTVSYYDDTVPSDALLLKSVSGIKDESRYATLPSSTIFPNAKHLNGGWYKDKSRSQAYASETKISANVSLYGDFIVTAASFASWIMGMPDGSVTADCKSNYTTGKTYFDAMTDPANFTAASYAAAYARWQKWQAANA
jgi:hypothetical protein